MKRRKDLFDAMRDGGRSMRQQPSNRSWRRLEDRLDNRRQKPTFSIMRALSMAAAVAILIVAVYGVSWLGDKTNKQMAMNDAASMSTLEDLTYTDVDYEAYQAVELRNDYAENDYFAMAESAPRKRLVAAKTMTSPSRGVEIMPSTTTYDDNTLIAANQDITENKTLDVADANITMNYTQNGQATPTNDWAEVKETMEAEEVADAIAESPAKIASKDQTTAAMQPSADIAMNDMSEAASILTEKNNAPIASRSAKKEMAKSKKRSNIDTQIDLQWLVGNWEVRGKEDLQLHWKDHSPLLIGSEPTNSGLKVSFIAEDNNTFIFLEMGDLMPTTMTLTDAENKMLIFNNEENKFPNKLIIKRINGHAHQFIMQHNTAFSEKQIRFLQQEGFEVDGRKAIRTMKRVK